MSVSDVEDTSTTTKTVSIIASIAPSHRERE